MKIGLLCPIEGKSLKIQDFQARGRVHSVPKKISMDAIFFVSLLTFAFANITEERRGF